MTEQQERISALFGWTSLAVVIVSALYFLEEIQTFVSSLFRPTYEVRIGLAMSDTATWRYSVSLTRLKHSLPLQTAK